MTASKKRSAAEFLPQPEVEQPEPIKVEVVEQPELIEAEVAQVLDPEPEAPAVISDPVTVADLMKVIQGLQTQVENLTKSQNRIIEETSDLTDNLWFITRPNGSKTMKKAIVRDPNGKAVRIMVEDIRTAYVGPFETEEQVRTYLAAKAKKRPDSVIDWASCDVMLGRDAREIQRREEKMFQKAYGNDPEANVNILERRVMPKFDQSHADQKAALGLTGKEGKATGEVALPRVLVKKLADGTETLDIRDR